MTTDIHQHLSLIASAISDPSRAKMLCGLMDGRAYTATELSAMAEISPSTTSTHLAKLMSQGFIRQIKQGRYRYFCLLNEDVAHLLETLMSFTLSAESKTIKSSTPLNLRTSRSCYNHLAGSISVHITQYFQQENWITGVDEYVLTDFGQAQLNKMGMPPEFLYLHKQRIGRSCLDWSERKPHIAGALGKQLLIFFEQKKWLNRFPQTREIRWTTEGKIMLTRYFNIQHPILCMIS